jgi:toxin FitB
VTYLLDTNVVAEITAKPKPDPRVLAWFDATPTANCYLSVLTIAEIEAGVAAASDPVRQAGYAFVLSQLRHDYHGRIISLNEREATTYLQIHKSLKSLGQGIDPPDALIAATALANGWTLASRNVKHLARTGVDLINPWEYLP